MNKRDNYACAKMANDERLDSRSNMSSWRSRTSFICILNDGGYKQIAT